MTIKKHRSSDIHWISHDKDGKVWFESKIAIIDFKPASTTDETISKHLTQLLKSAVRLNSEFLDKWNGFKVLTHLEFERDWGLGSSSTLTHLVAQWAEIHPLSLHFKANAGSGYDVACAGAESPILYQLDGDDIHIEPLDQFRPKYADNLYFVHLNQKQSTATGVAYYTKKVKGKKTLARTLTQLTEELIEAKTLTSFDKIITEHESVLSKALGIDTVKSLQFSDYWGSMKSLGAWGGDFVLATSDRETAETKQYFAERGYDTVLGLDEILI